MLEKLVYLCKTFGSGALATEFNVQEVSLVPHRLSILYMLGQLCSSKQAAIGTVSGALSIIGATVALA